MAELSNHQAVANVLIELENLALGDHTTIRWERSTAPVSHESVQVEIDRRVGSTSEWLAAPVSSWAEFVAGLTQIVDDVLDVPTGVVRQDAATTPYLHVPDRLANLDRVRIDSTTAPSRDSADESLFVRCRITLTRASGRVRTAELDREVAREMLGFVFAVLGDWGLDVPR